MKLTAELSVSSLDALLKKLQEQKEKIESAPRKITEGLVEAGRLEINNILSSAQRDGNYDVKSGEYLYDTSGFVYLEGSQAAYVEYGTGLIGANQPHPQANQAGWKYGSGKTVKQSGDWSYWDPIKKQYVHTKGIPAQMPVFKAAVKMREQITEIGKKAMK